MDKHYHVHYSLRVNKEVDHSFKLAHYDIWSSYIISLTLGFKYLCLTAQGIAIYLYASSFVCALQPSRC